MKRQIKACRVLAAAGTEAGVSAIRNALRGLASREDMVISQALTLSQVRQKISPYSGAEPVDILVLKLPLEDETGIEAILEMAVKNRRLQTPLLLLLSH